MAEKVKRRLAAILSVDVVSYTRLVGAVEEGSLARLMAHRTDIIDHHISNHHPHPARAPWCAASELQ